jgi:crotonobetainyl-CoA:carnitine CoA-transferase CaiB-like acyl-CoA transferase
MPGAGEQADKMQVAVSHPSDRPIHGPLRPRNTMTHLPFEGLRVVEFTHMVMGPTCGMVLADLGAEVIKVEPPSGDNTRRLLGAGAGFYPLFNRNKKSLVLDLQSPEGKEAVLKLIATADVVSENFKPETMKKLGLDYASLQTLNPRLIHVSHKGFLPGPYDHAPRSTRWCR